MRWWQLAVHGWLQRCLRGGNLNALDVSEYRMNALFPHLFINFINFLCFCWASWIVSGGAGLWVCQFCKFAQQLLAKVRSESTHILVTKRCWNAPEKRSTQGLLSLQAVLWSDRKQLAGQDTRCSCSCGWLPQKRSFCTPQPNSMSVMQCQDEAAALSWHCA